MPILQSRLKELLDRAEFHQSAASFLSQRVCDGWKEGAEFERAYDLAGEPGLVLALESWKSQFRSLLLLASQISQVPDQVIEREKLLWKINAKKNDREAARARQRRHQTPTGPKAWPSQTYQIKPTQDFAEFETQLGQAEESFAEALLAPRLSEPPTEAELAAAALQGQDTSHWSQPPDTSQQSPAPIANPLPLSKDEL